MRTNTLLTYLLYALLAGLICVAGYKACQMKSEEARLAQESKDEAFQKQMRDYGYLEDDTTGSQYTSDENTGTEPSPGTSTSVVTDKPAVTQDGIEEETPAATTTKPAAETSTSKPSTTTTKGVDPEPVDRVSNSDTDSKPRYNVVAGSFEKVAAARRQMEKLIQMGYENAEIGYTNGGKYAVVVVKRTNSLNEANKIVDRLEAKGIDVNVIDRKRKK